MTPLDLLFAGERLVADPAGALCWPAERTLIVSDLHLAKSTAMAARSGHLLPPYDSKETLTRLGRLIDRYQPKTVISLGDSFDRKTIGLSSDNLAALEELMANRTWVWVLGNHDPDLPHVLPGEMVEEWTVGALVFRHEAAPELPPVGERFGEVSGHFHPKATINIKGRRVKGRCFIHDDRRLILPAFGTYTGGLDVNDPALDALFTDATVALCTDRAVYAVPVTMAEG